MTRILTSKATTIFKSACLIAASVGLISASANANANTANGNLKNSEQKLVEFVDAYTFLYYSLGACDGFIDPAKEAPFDPFGPALEKWPNEFRSMMSQTREDGRIESTRLAKQLGLTHSERAELCSRQVDGANADIQRLIAKYAN